MNSSVVLIGEEEPFEAILEHSINLKGIDIIGIVSSKKGLARAKKKFMKKLSSNLYFSTL